MRATRESIKTFFRRPYVMLASDYVQDALERLRRSRANITKTTAQLTGMPGGGGSDRGAQLAQFMDAEHQALVALSGVSQAKRDNKQLIAESVLTDRQRTILTERFVRCRPCKRVADRVGISVRQLYRDEEAAFDSCAAYVTLHRPAYATEALIDTIDN